MAGTSAVELIFRIRGDAKQGQKVLNDFDKKAGKAGKSVEKGWSGMQKMAATAGAAVLGSLVFGLNACSEKFVTVGKDALFFQRTLHTNAKESSELAAMFRRLGIEPQRAAMTLRALSNAVASDNKVLLDNGIATRDVSGKHRDLVEVLKDVADKYSTMDDRAAANAMASKVLGRGYTSLLPVLSAGSQGIQDIMDKAEKYGLILTQQNINQVRAYIAAQKDAEMANTGLEISFGRLVLPLKTELYTWLGKVLQSLNSYSLGAKLAAVETAGAVGALLLFVGTLPKLVAGIQLLAVALSNPAVLVVAACAAIGYGIWRVVEASNNAVTADTRLADASRNVASALRGEHQATMNLRRAVNDVTRAHLNVIRAKQDYAGAVKQYKKNSLQAREALVNQREAELNLADAQKTRKDRIKDLTKAQADLKKKTDAYYATYGVILDQIAAEMAKGPKANKKLIIKLEAQIPDLEGDIPYLINRVNLFKKHLNDRIKPGLTKMAIPLTVKLPPLAPFKQSGFNMGRGYWQSFAQGIGIGSPSYIDRALAAHLVTAQRVAVLMHAKGLLAGQKYAAGYRAAGPTWQQAFNTNVAIMERNAVIANTRNVKWGRTAAQSYARGITSGTASIRSAVNSILAIMNTLERRIGTSGGGGGGRGFTALTGPPPSAGGYPETNTVAAASGNLFNSSAMAQQLLTAYGFRGRLTPRATLAMARAFIGSEGAPYVFGASSRTESDCSGAISYLLRAGRLISGRYTSGDFDTILKSGRGAFKVFGRHGSPMGHVGGGFFPDSNHPIYVEQNGVFHRSDHPISNYTYSGTVADRKGIVTRPGMFFNANRPGEVTGFTMQDFIDALGETATGDTYIFPIMPGASETDCQFVRETVKEVLLEIGPSLDRAQMGD
jgi:hypothetical protein